jgi:pimeloyl-ACP methyl ester carboxylesterase
LALPAFLGAMGATQYPSQYTTVGSTFVYSFVGRQTGLVNTGRMWITPGYDPTDWNTGWSTVYALHGKGGSSLTTSLQVLPRYIDAIAALQIRPGLFIMPDAGQNWYANAFDGSSPGETKIMGDLIPQVDEHTHSQGDVGRVITGFSMGGFGALRLASKYSTKFRGVCAYAFVNCDVDLTTNFTSSDLADYTAIWNANINLLRPDAPAASISNLGLAEVNAATLIAYPPSGYPIRLVRSTADAVSFTMAGNYGAALTAVSVPFTGIVNLVTPTHNVGQYYTADAGNGFAFLEAALAA